MTNGWHVGKFGDVLEPVSRPVQVEADKVYRNLGVQWYAHGLFIREEKPGHEIQAKELYRVELGDLVYNRLFAWKGSFAIADKDTAGGFVSGEFPCFRVDSKLADVKYLHLYLSQEKIWEEIERTSTGQTSISRLRLKVPVFLGMDIPLPPLEEQRRIVKSVEDLVTRIAKAKSLREEIDAETELLPAAEFKKLRYELLESKFPKNKLGNITQVTAGGTPSRDNPSYWKGKIPWIKTGELLDGDIYSSGEHITEEGMKYSSAKLFPKETILIALYGQGQTRGRTGRLMIEATTNQACCAILPTPDLLEPRFTQYWLRSLYYEMREQNHGGAQPNWNGAMIKNIEISIPPLDEQRRIVAYLDSVQARLASLRQLQSATGEELDALLPSVLDRAFKGEL